VDVTALQTTYTRLLAAADAALDREVPDLPGEPGPDWTLAHIALSDRLLASTARQVLGPEEASIDNSGAMDPAAIAELTSSVERDVLVDLVRRNAAELLGLVERTPAESAARPIRVRLVNGSGREVFSGQLPWGELLRMRADEHLPGHTDRLRRLVAAAG
jgi:hypothetical protein